MSITDHWPLFGLTISTPRLELRAPTDADIEQLVEVASNGVHTSEMMPFTTPWTDLESPELERSALQYWWRCRAELSPTAWELNFVVIYQGQPIGIQGLSAKDFPIVRNAESGSWLGIDYHGQGIGTEMRTAVLHFAFTNLEAEAITSSAFVDNIASQRVSEHTGYERNGIAFAERRGERSELIRYLLTKKRWLETKSDLPIEVEGFEPCRPLLGLDPIDQENRPT